MLATGVCVVVWAGPALPPLACWCGKRRGEAASKSHILYSSCELTKPKARNPERIFTTSSLSFAFFLFFTRLCSLPFPGDSRESGRLPTPTKKIVGTQHTQCTSAPVRSALSNQNRHQDAKGKTKDGGGHYRFLPAPPLTPLPRIHVIFGSLLSKGKILEMFFLILFIAHVFVLCVGGEMGGGSTLHLY